MPQVKVGWRSGSVAAPSVSTMLLDVYSGASAAYSLRKLKSSYTGSGIRVRRSSDNTELNIGFDSDGNLDTVALSAFVGTGNGFVTTWYDQSGNGRDAIQTTAGNQPIIVSSGIIINLNNKSSIYFNGSSFMNTIQNVLSVGNGGYSVFGLGRPGGSPNCLFYIGSSTGNNGVGLNNNNGTPRHYWFANDYDSGQTFVNTNSIFVISYDGTKRYTTINNVTTSANSSGKNTTNPTLSIGRLPGYSQNLVGYESELVIYDLNKESIRTNITNDINSYYSAYPNPTSVWNLLAAAYNADSVASSSLKTSLVASYNGESNANDSFGTNNGSAVGGLTYGTGKIGNAFTFNGSNAYVSLPRTTNQFDFTGDFSISVWIKQSTDGNIFQNFYGTSLANRFGYSLYTQSGRVRFAIYTSDATHIGQSGLNIATNTWYHIIITKTSSNAFKIYIDGTLQTLTTISGNISNNPSYNVLNQVNIGSEVYNGSRSNYFNGQIDALNLWQKSLTQSEITELYNSGNGAQYITDNFYKPTTNDALGTNNGTAQGGLTYGLGKVGTAFVGNGTNGYVSLPNNSWNFTGTFSINIWAYLSSSSTNSVLCSNYYWSSGGRDYGFLLEHLSNGTLRFYMQTLSNSPVIVSTSYSGKYNSWKMITITKLQNGSLKMYIDGTSIATNYNTPDIFYNSINYTSIAAARYLGTTYGYLENNGKIDALNIWTRELSASEVTELYNSGNGKQYPN